MDGRIDEWMVGWMDGGWMDEWMVGWIVALKDVIK